MNAGHLRRDIEKKSRLADAGLAREKNDSTWHETATENAVELSHARR